MNRQQRRAAEHHQARQRAQRRIPAIPMMRTLRDQFGMQMHTALASLSVRSDIDAFNNLAHVFNVVQVAIRDDAKRMHESRLIVGGAAALNQAMPKVLAGLPLAAHELAPVRVAVNAMDEVMGKISVTALHCAAQELNEMRGRA